MERTIDGLIDGVLDSYSRIGGINHIEGLNLPSRQSIQRIVDELSAIVFPGFHCNESLTPRNLRYLIGGKVEEAARALTEEVEKSLRYVCRDREGCHDKNCLGEAEKLVFDFLEGLPEIRRLVSLDVEAAVRGDPAARSAEEVILSYPCVEAIMVHRIAHVLWRQGIAMIPRMMSEYAHGRTGIDIHPGATIGESFFIDHGTGVVIGETTVIGRDVKLYQGVTLGALSVRKEEANKKRHPTIGDGVTIYAGATILGGATEIGEGSVIGGNVWITQSVPPHSTIYHQPTQETRTGKGRT